MTSRYRLISHVTRDFWQRWSAEASPSLIVRQKWHRKSRNLCVGDVVMIAEPTKMKARYKLAVVEEVKVSRDGFVRSAILRYNNITSVMNNKRAVPVRVSRSVQCLILILPVEEQSSPLVVEEDEHQVHVSECGQ